MAIKLTAQSHTHEQTTPSVMWVVTHNLGRLPAIDVYVNHQGSLQKIQPKNIVRQDENVSKIFFSRPMTGMARAI